MRTRNNFIRYIFIAMVFLPVAFFLLSFRVSDKKGFADGNPETFTDTPVLTVLTHGLGGSPTDWSNDSIFPSIVDLQNNPNNHYIMDNTLYVDTEYRYKHFNYNSDSLIEQLRQKNPNSFVYIVSANNNASVNNGNPYIDKFTPNSSSPTGYSAEAVTTMDFSKHSIIVYNAESTGKTFAVYDGDGYDINHLDFTADSVVEDFYTTINYIVGLYQATNNNILPKINLIGHSQGTIVNLLYATKYPDMIDSMFALGGLFNGSAILRAIYGVGTGTIER